MENGRYSVADRKKLGSMPASLPPRQATVEKLNMDPIAFPWCYPSTQDREVVA
ncbi:MAG: hypothetical protein GXO70_11275 [Acidobacteria bacterium]|nr:hypothetical protein [Acidobacteriota bacterium]